MTYKITSTGMFMRDGKARQVQLTNWTGAITYVSPAADGISLDVRYAGRGRTINMSTTEFREGRWINELPLTARTFVENPFHVVQAIQENSGSTLRR